MGFGAAGCPELGVGFALGRQDVRQAPASEAVPGAAQPAGGVYAGYRYDCKNGDRQRLGCMYIFSSKVKQSSKKG